MANNRIPRNAKRIYITWKVDATGNKSGDHATVERIDGKWIETTESGKTYYMPLALLRNADVLHVDQIETDEPNNRNDVLLSDVGTQVYIIDGASRTDKAAKAVITALCNNGRITGELAERAKNDRPTVDKIKRNLLHVQMEERETEGGKHWTFYTASGVYMDIPSYSPNYIRADKHGNLYPAEAQTETEITEGKEDTTTAETEPQNATESAEKTADDTTTAGSDTDRTEATQDAEKTIRTGARLYSHPHRHMVIVDGLQGELVRVIYRGRLYLVCCGDLYTDETETTPAILPSEPEEATTGATSDGTTEAGETSGNGETLPQDATSGPDDATTATQDSGVISGTDRTPPQNPGHACENAPGRTERHGAEQVHTQHTKSPPRAAQKAGERNPSKGPQPQKQVFGPIGFYHHQIRRFFRVYPFGMVFWERFLIRNFEPIWTTPLGGTKI